MPHKELLYKHNLFSLERNHLRADLILFFEIFKGEIGLSLSDPKMGGRARLQNTTSTNLPSIKNLYIVCAGLNDSLPVADFQWHAS